MRNRPAASQLAIYVTISFALVWAFFQGSSKFSVNPAFADNTTTTGPKCPDPIEGCTKEIYDNVCYMVCDRGGTSAPMPEPLPTATPIPTDTPAPTPSQTPQGPTSPTGPLTFEQKVKKLNDRCPNSYVPTQTERYYMIQEAADVCAAVIKEYPSCQYLLGSQTTSYIAFHTVNSDPFDPGTVLQSLRDNSKLIDAARSSGSVGAFTQGGTGADGAGRINFLDPFFGLTRPDIKCSGANYYCTEADIDAELAKPAKDTKCTGTAGSTESRAHLLCHELGHRTKNGRHDFGPGVDGWKAQMEYTDLIQTNCRIRL